MSSKARKDEGQRLLPSDSAAIARQATEFLRVAYRWQDTRPTETSMRSLALYPPNRFRDGMWLAIAKAGVGSERVVTFYRASDPLTALSGIMQKIASGKAEWKADKWEG